jgi:hypothetical protein
MIEQMRQDILLWVRAVYEALAEKNEFTQYPEPYFSPINLLTAKELIQYGLSYIEKGIISKNTGALLFGHDYMQEEEQIAYERSVDTDPSNTTGNTTTSPGAASATHQTALETSTNEHGI